MTGRALPPSSPFAGDDGSADPALAAALESVSRGTGSLADVVGALARTSRVLVPVLAELDVADVVVHEGHEGHEGHGLTVDKEASAGIVALQAPDGRTALPVFSSVDAMSAWRAQARPVPTTVPRAALSAVAEGWEVMVVDPGGPASVLVPRTAVWALARAEPWRPAVADGAVGVDVRRAVAGALADVTEVVRTDVEPGRRAEVAVVLALVPGLDRRALDAVLARVNAALAADGTVAARVDSLELRLRAAV
ncbi:SseB family protein [Cellulomonas fimi]|uniref:SseB family protein n=1 Tax=Cellulomonas fimi TaxID=1708 RepID=A0A7Y0LZ54_CELFI|nr:SseB family protein [Cellulomonas fimi]NMR20585.1 SseB family protein [Cellulomonas fimi]